jgi:hypothetical protein
MQSHGPVLSQMPDPDPLRSGTPGLDPVPTQTRIQMRILVKLMKGGIRNSIE